MQPASPETSTRPAAVPPIPPSGRATEQLSSRTTEQLNSRTAETCRVAPANGPQPYARLEKKHPPQDSGYNKVSNYLVPYRFFPYFCRKQKSPHEDRYRPTTAGPGLRHPLRTRSHGHVGRGGKRRVRRRAGDNAPAGRSADPVSGSISGVGTSGRRIHDPLHGNVHGADRHPLQPLWRQHMPADSALRRRRLRNLLRRELPDGIRRFDAAGARRQELLPFVLQRLRIRRHFPRVPVSGIAAAGLCSRDAAGADPSAGDTAFQAYLPRSGSRRRRADTAPPDRLLCQLGHG